LKLNNQFTWGENKSARDLPDQDKEYAIMFAPLPKLTIKFRKLLWIVFGCIVISATGISQTNLKISLSENQKKGLYKIEAVVSCGPKTNKERAIVQMAFPSGSRNLSPYMYPVDLEPGKKQILHFKFYLPVDESQKDSIAVVGEVNSIGESTRLCKSKLLIAPPGQKPLQIENLSPELITDSKHFELSFKISNPSTTNQSVILKPQDYTGINFERISFELPAGKDTIIKIHEKVPGIEWFEQNRYINYYLLNEEGRILKSQVTRFIPHLAKKRFQAPNTSPNTFQQMELGYTGGDLGNFFHTRYSQDFTTLTERQSLSFQANYFPEINELRVFNSLYQFENEKMVFGLGNLSRNDELNIFGRGIYLGWKEDEYVFSFGAIIHNANLAGSFDPRYGNTGNSFYFDVEQQLKNYWKLKSAMVGNFNPDMNHGIWSIGLQKETETELFLINTGAGINFDAREMKTPGGFLDFQLQKKLGKFSFYGNNYLATLDHPGRRAGQQIYLNQLKYKLSDSWAVNLIARHRFFPTPSSRFSVFRAYSLNNRQEYQLLFEKVFNPNFQMAFSPKYLQQKAGYYVGNRLVESFKNTNPAFLGLMEWKKESTRISLTSEIGKYKTESERTQLSDEINWQVSSSFFWKGFSGNVRYQKGSIFFLEELDSGRGLEGKRFLSMGLGTNHSFFQNRLEINGGGQMVYNNTRKNWYKNYWLGLEYQLGPKLQALIKGNMLQSAGFSNFNWEVSLRKSISTSKTKGKKGNIKLTLKESGSNKPLKNLIIRLENQKLVSDEKGRVQLNKIPHGTYYLEIRDPSGNYPAYGDSIIIHQNNYTLTIPFNPPVEVNGQLQLERQRFSDDRISTSGLKIWIEDEFGKKRYTFTNMDGSYNFKIPTGNYKIWIDKSGLPEELEVQNNFGKLTLDSEVQTMSYNFKLLVRSRKTKIKYFND
jgi:hypothetical protein